MPERTCSIEGCNDRHFGRGWCMKHYSRWRRHGDPLALTRILGDDVARFWSHVDKNGPIPEARPDLGPCWPWTGGRTKGGYAALGVEDEILYAHRFAYATFVGPIPDEHQVDHLCFVRHCVNYERHLEAVTQPENIRRAAARSR